MNRGKIDFSAIAENALNHIETLLSAWLPNGKKHGHEYQALNPTRADSKIGSFSVNLNTGAWGDFATDDFGGDLISLYAYLFGVKMGESAREIAKQLHIDAVIPPAPLSPSAQTIKEKPTQNDDWETITPIPEYALAHLHDTHPFREKNGKSRLMENIYRDADGQILGMVVRFPTSDGGKEDIPRTFGLNKKTGLQEWKWKFWTPMRPIYGLDVLTQKPNAPVLIVEGEKCKNVAEQSGQFDDFAVISWAGGCNAWQKTVWQALQNRRVVLFPDADAHREKLSKEEKEQGVKPESKPLLPAEEQGGLKAMLGIEQLLRELGCETAIVEIPEPNTWTAGYDIADMLTDAQPLANARELVEQALARVSPALTLQCVSQSVAENTLDQQQGDGGGDTAYQVHFNELKKYFALVEGKRAAVDVRTAVVYSYQALKARFCKDSVDSWFNQPNKPMRTQYEIKSLKESIELKNKNNDKETVEMMDRYVYLDGSSSVWDNQLWRIIDQGAAKLAMGDDFKFWVNSPMRKVIPIDNIIFNPKVLDLGKDYINLFRGLPFQPKYAVPREEMPQDWGEVIQLYPECKHIYLLVKHICNDDWLIIQFVLNWLAYPLQNMGAKMATNLVVHGEVQGAGKSWLFDDIMGQIYGEYGGHYGQEDLETIYTANRSAKLYGAFEEVFNNQQKYSNTGKIKNLVTRKTHRIERKFIDAREEANHINAVFTSNEEQPYKLDENDRRAFVLSPQNKIPSWLKDAINEEIANGGVQAFYSLLMSLPLMINYEYQRDEETGLENVVCMREKPIRFDANTEAPMTEAKRLVISFGRFGWQTFYHQWKNGDIEGIPYGCCKTDDLYRLFMWWVKVNNEREMSRPRFLDHISTKMYRAKRWWRCPTSNRPDEKKQNYIFKPKDMIVPEGHIEMDYIGTQVLRFKNAVDELLRPRYDN